LLTVVCVGCRSPNARTSRTASIAYHETAVDQWFCYLVHRYARLSIDYLDMELMDAVGDTKAGALIAKDRFGNKYYENLEEELPCELS
jgi:hypothetical protein